MTTDAQTLLNNFCEWQYSVNELDDNHPNHHDTAVLLTRYSLYSNITYHHLSISPHQYYSQPNNFTVHPSHYFHYYRAPHLANQNTSYTFFIRIG